MSDEAQTIYLVGQIKGPHRRKPADPSPPWEIQGIFDSVALAEAACRDENYFVQPMKLNESLPHETVEPPAGGYYPHYIEPRTTAPGLAVE
jgi:hypothetical protein